MTEGISLCMDFVMNHTSEDHEWAVKRAAGRWGIHEPVFLLCESGDSAGIRKDSAAGIPDNSAGQFYLSAGDGALCDDNILPVSVGSELQKSQSI